MLTSTYQHDYINPHERRLRYLLKFAPKEAVQHTADGQIIKECQCIEEPKVQVSAKAKECPPKPEWTGIQPMGRLIDPKLIPKGAGSDADKIDEECVNLKPNRFLKILRSVYPDLYERLKQMPPDELTRRIEHQRMTTTYRVDFGNELVTDDRFDNDEYTPTRSDPHSKTKASCTGSGSDKAQGDFAQPSGDGYYLKDDPCAKLYKPFKTDFSDSSSHPSDMTGSKWPPVEWKTRPPVTEYMDSISRNGCIIIKNDLHNHKKCLKNQICTHEITELCVNSDGRDLYKHKGRVKCHKK